MLKTKVGGDFLKSSDIDFLNGDMAESAEANDGAEINNDSRQQSKLSHRFMELFHGRFNTTEAEQILKDHTWHILSAVNFVLNSSPEDLRRRLGEQDEQQWQEVRQRNSRQKRREEAFRNENLRQLAIRNVIHTEVRQFACKTCDKVWWRKVPTRKMVSRCFRCRSRFDCLPRELEWGWAKFVCRCNFVFYGFGAMGRTLCLCYHCNKEVWPLSIIPPKEQERRRSGLRRRNTHSCLGINCYNRTIISFNHPVMMDRNILEDLICVHPKSLHKQVVEESDVHRSKGSTVDTFLTQDGLETHDPLGVYLPSVPTIREEDTD